MNCQMQDHLRELALFPESMAKGSSVGFMGGIIMRVIAKSYHHQSHCTESLHREALARRNARESHLRGAMLMRATGEEPCS